VSADGANWVLVDASPDILAQLRSFPEAQPARAIRDTASMVSKTVIILSKS
jgi:pyrroloquinoline quinone biosynthesis protein B